MKRLIPLLSKHWFLSLENVNLEFSNSKNEMPIEKYIQLIGDTFLLCGKLPNLIYFEFKVCDTNDKIIPLKVSQNEKCLFPKLKKLRSNGQFDDSLFTHIIPQMKALQVLSLRHWKAPHARKQILSDFIQKIVANPRMLFLQEITLQYLGDQNAISEFDARLLVDKFPNVAPSFYHKSKFKDLKQPFLDSVCNQTQILLKDFSSFEQSFLDKQINASKLEISDVIIAASNKKALRCLVSFIERNYATLRYVEFSVKFKESDFIRKVSLCVCMFSF